MSQHTWPTKYKDLRIAQEIMEQYAQENDTQTLSIFDWVFDPIKKRMDFHFSQWIAHLIIQFTTMYGLEQGDFVSRQIISKLIVQGETLH